MNRHLHDLVLLGLIVAVGLLVMPRVIGDRYTQPNDLWDDLRFPASSLLILGFGADPARDPVTGVLLFDWLADERVFATAQMPHGYVQGSNIVAHVHWAKSTSAAGDVCWSIDYDCKDIGETFNGAILPTTLTMTYAVDDDDTAFKHAIAEVSFDPAFNGVSGICQIELFRDISGSGGCLDDYLADAVLYEFDIHYQADVGGSVSESQKYQ